MTAYVVTVVVTQTRKITVEARNEAQARADALKLPGVMEVLRVAVKS